MITNRIIVISFFYVILLWHVIHICSSAPERRCHATLRPHHLCLFSKVVWRCTYSGILFHITFVQCMQSDSCHYWHSNRSFLLYLLTPIQCYWFLKMVRFLAKFICWFYVCRRHIPVLSSFSERIPRHSFRLHFFRCLFVLSRHTRCVCVRHHVFFYLFARK